MTRNDNDQRLRMLRQRLRMLRNNTMAKARSHKARRDAGMRPPKPLTFDQAITSCVRFARALNHELIRLPASR